MSTLNRRSQPMPLPPPPPPTRWVGKPVEEKKPVETTIPQTEAKWNSLKAYCRSKGLCFFLWEKWGRDHQCKASIQPHVVLEMIDCLQLSEMEVELGREEGEPKENLMHISLAAMNPSFVAPKTMQLTVTVQGKLMLFPIDSGSSTCFIDHRQAAFVRSATGKNHECQCGRRGHSVEYCGNTRAAMELAGMHLQ